MIKTPEDRQAIVEIEITPTMPKDVRASEAGLAPLVRALQSRQELRARELLLDPVLAAQARRMSRLDPVFGKLISELRVDLRDSAN